MGHSLALKYWPPAPFSWIDRYQQTGWPFASVLSEIISQGMQECHLMPIVSKRKSEENELGWTFVFSSRT